MLLLPHLAGGQVSGFWSGAPGGGPALARPSGGARARRRRPRSVRPAAPGAGRGRRPAAARPRRRISLGELVAAARPGPGRHQPFQPGALQRGGRLVVRRPGVPERRRGLGDRGAVRPDLPHHLVFDLHRVAGVEELAGQELRVGHLLGVRVQAARPGQRGLLGVRSALLAWPCRLPILVLSGRFCRT